MVKIHISVPQTLTYYIQLSPDLEKYARKGEDEANMKKVEKIQYF